MAHIRKERNKFQQYCMDNGLTAAMVAERIGVSKSTVFAYYSGQRLPSRKTCKQIKEKLGVDPNELF